MADSSVTTSMTIGVKRKHSQIDDPKQLVCGFAGCGRAFTSERSFTRHMNSHSEQYAPPSSYQGWKQHFEYRHIHGLPDGRVWSSKAGRFLNGHFKDGYVHLKIEGKTIQRHRLNFEIANGRAIRPGLDIDHIVPSKSPDDSWANLQEIARPEHNIKTRADNPGMATKCSETKGFPVFVQHIASGKEDEYASITAAARALGLNVSVVSLRAKEGSNKEYKGYVFRRCPLHVASQADRPDEEWMDAKLEGFSKAYGSAAWAASSFVTGGARRARLCMGGTRLIFGSTGRTLKSLSTISWPTRSLDRIDGICNHDVIGNLRYATKIEQGRNMKNNRAVSKYDLQGILLKTYGTMAEAAEDNRLSYQRMRYAVRTGSTATGFQWKCVRQ